MSRLRLLVAAVVVAAPLLASVAQAQGGDLKATVDPQALSLPAGRAFYANLTLANAAPRTIALDITTHTPNSTRMVVRVANTTVKLAPNETTRVAAFVAIPNGTPEGDQPVVFALHDNATGSTTNVTIALRVGLLPTPTTPRPTPPPTAQLAAPTPATPVSTPASSAPTLAPPSPSRTSTVQAAAELPAPRDAPRPATLLWWAAGGAAAVGAVSGGFALARKRWPWLLSPLYTRLAKARILEQPTRERIAETVKAEPGITFGELQRRLGLAAGQLTHHARKLEDAGVLYSSPDGQTRRFFHVGQGRVEAVPPLRDRALAVLSQRAMTLSELAAELGVSKQALHYHVKKLEEAGLVTASQQGELVAVVA